MQIKQTPTVYDVCIIGSGAGGGAAAYVLTKAGANVLMLEAGPQWDSATDSAMFKWPYDSPRRGASTPERSFGEFDGCIGAWQIDGEPYTVRRASGSTGIAPACWAAARTTGAASRCAWVPTTSAARASTASARTGRSRTTT